MTATPVWFGPAARPLFGWVHTPPGGRARAGVVICPPFIREHLQAHYTLRLLAEELERRDIAALRFDYDGMGDSAGDARDPHRVAAWLASVHHGMRLLSDAGVPAVSLVGMRIGATLAAQAAFERGRVPQLVLWDPCVSGRSYLREQAAVAQLALRREPEPGDRSSDTPGLRFSEETVGEMRDLNLERLRTPVADRVLLLSREDRERAGGVMASLGAAGVEQREATGQAALMDRGMPWLEIPYGLLSGVADWIDDGAPGSSVPVRIPPQAGQAVVGATPDGSPIVERPVSIGPAGLFGIVTEVPGQVGPGPAAVFVNVANGHHVGPNRMWVDLARQWAAHGIRSLRFDLSGVGDSPVRRPAQEPFVARAAEAFADVADAANAIAPHDPRQVVLIGHCASAYQAIDSALELGVAGVVALNPVLSFVPPELERHQPLDAHRRAALPRTPLIESFHGTGRLSALRERVPSLGWRVRLWSHPGRRPGAWLRTLATAGTDVLVVNGEREHRPFRLGMSRYRRARLERTGLLRIEYRPELEHGLLLGDQRAMVADLVTAHVVDRFARRRTPPGADGVALDLGVEHPAAMAPEPA